MPPKIGPRQFSTKVRTGCVTCKRRRVKCDEQHPNCSRCIHSGIECEGYKVPKQWLFEGSSLVVTKKESESPPTKDTLVATRQYSRVRPSIKKAVPKCISTPREQASLGMVSIPRLAPIFSPTCSDDHATKRALEFWVVKVSVNLAQWGPGGKCWTEWMPRVAQSYAAVKHLMVAGSMLDESQGYPTTAGFSPDALILTRLRLDALSHYQTAILEILNKQNPLIVLVLASILAFGFEMALGNSSAAAVHINAASKLISENSSRAGGRDAANFVEIDKEIRTCVEMCVGYSMVRTVEGEKKNSEVSQRISIHEEPRLQPFNSLQDARNQIDDRVRLFCRKTQTPETNKEFRVWVSRWHTSILTHPCPSPGLVLHRNILYQFFCVSLALLPGSEVGRYSYAVNHATVEHALDIAERTIREDLRSGSPEIADVKETLEFLLDLISCRFPNTAAARRAGYVLKELNA